MTEEEQELSRKVALALPDRGVFRDLATAPGELLPPYATSLDACFGPGGPVEYAKARGWRLELVDTDLGWKAILWYADEPIADEFGDTLAAAICLTLLAVVEVPA